MKSTRRNVRTQSKAVGNLAKAGRNLRQNTKLAIAAGEVVGARTRMAATGLMNPVAMDHGEMARMVPEKMIAFNFAGLAFAQHATRMATQLMMNAAAEWSAMARQAFAMTSARNPFQVASAHSNGVMNWWARAMSQATGLSTNILSAQQAMARPIHNTVRANAKRLSSV